MLKVTLQVLEPSTGDIDEIPLTGIPEQDTAAALQALAEDIAGDFFSACRPVADPDALICLGDYESGDCLRIAS